MMILYDFRCTNDHTYEDFASMSEESKICPQCGAESKRLISPVKAHLDGTDPGFPGAWMSWEKKREQKIKQEQKKNES